MAKKSRSLARRDYGYNTRIVKGRKPRTGFWKSLNKPRELVRPNGVFNPHARIYGVIIILVLVMGGVFLFDQSLKNPNTHGLLGGTSPIDPLVGIWGDDGSAQLSNWNTILASYSSTMGHLGAGKSIKLSPNTTNTAVALTKNPIGDLSVISGKELYMLMTWTADSWNIFQPIGFYLTTNKTLPVAKYYDPLFDPSVAFLVYTAPDSPNFISRELVQRSPGVSLNTNDVGEFDLTGCGNSGTCYLGVRAATMNPLPGGDAFPENSNALLNFTGPSPGPGGVRACNNVGTGTGCSYVQLQASYNATAKLPQLPFQGVSYYLGVYAFTSLNPFNPAVIYYGFDGSAAGGVMQADYYVPTATTVSTAPNIDTGGFFGSVIKALISIGVFIVSSLFQFIGFVWTAAIQGFDIIGNFLGIGAIGTAFNSIIASVAGFIISVLTGLIQTFVNMTLATGQILTLFTTGFSNYFTALTGWMAALASLFGTVWTVLGGLLGYAKFSFMTLAVAWWCWGIYEAIFVGFPSWMTWAKQTLSITLFFFRGIWWLTQTAWATILNVKSLIHPTAAGGGGTPPP